MVPFILLEYLGGLGGIGPLLPGGGLSPHDGLVNVDGLLGGRGDRPVLGEGGIVCVEDVVGGVRDRDSALRLGSWVLGH